jgi:hypothetical protein
MLQPDEEQDPRISNEEVISAFSTGVIDIKMKEKLSVNDELTSVVRLFEIADRCAKAEEGRLFVHNLPEGRFPKSPSPRPLSVRRLLPSRRSLIISSTVGTAPSVIRVDTATTASSTRRTSTILTIVGWSKNFIKRMESPSIMGVAVATARVDRGATAATMTGTRVVAVMVRHV